MKQFCSEDTWNKIFDAFDISIVVFNIYLISLFRINKVTHENTSGLISDSIK